MKDLRERIIKPPKVSLKKREATPGEWWTPRQAKVSMQYKNLNGKSVTNSLDGLIKATQH